MPLVFPLLAMLRELWGRPPGLRGTPSSRIRNNGVSVLQGASRPTGASAAVQGDRPTIYAGAQHRKKRVALACQAAPQSNTFTRSQYYFANTTREAVSLTLLHA